MQNLRSNFIRLSFAPDAGASNFGVPVVELGPSTTILPHMGSRMLAMHAAHAPMLEREYRRLGRTAAGHVEKECNSVCDLCSRGVSHANHLQFH
jgi:hypothetical protein